MSGIGAMCSASWSDGRLRGKRMETARRSDEGDGRRYIEGEYADYIQH